MEAVKLSLAEKAVRSSKIQEAKEDELTHKKVTQ